MVGPKLAKMALGNEPAALPALQLRPLKQLADFADAERDRWFYWLPVAFGGGASVYFSLTSEPSLLATLALAVLAGAIFIAGWRSTLAVMLSSILLTMTLGFTAAKLRTESVWGPVLKQPIGPVGVNGFIETLEPRANGSARMIVHVLEIEGLSLAHVPRRVRVSTGKHTEEHAPGDWIHLRAMLSPSPGPVLPGGYDFARAVWFKQIGGVGRATSIKKNEGEPPPAPLLITMSANIASLRQSIGERVRTVLPGQTGAIANALITGQRGEISEETNNAFRDAGLFHVLSISGLHMAIMGGAVFFTLRFSFALFPAIALRFPIKKWAAVGAALGSFAYLMISGGAFATVRAFIMISIMFLSVLLDRPAIALRNVALAALIILILYPESILDPGFQMSFAAVTALVSAYDFLSDRAPLFDERYNDMMRRLLMPFVGIAISTIVASLAVAPIAIYHFHKTQYFALLANLVAMPACNLMVMPGALATLVLMPFGLEAPALWVMGWGIDAMLYCAYWVAGLPGAVGTVPAIPPIAFGLIIAGGLWLLLIKQRARLFGLALIAVGTAVAPTRPSPDILVGRDAALVAVRAGNGQLMTAKSRRRSFEFQRWREHDGTSPNTKPTGTGPFRCDAVGCVAKVKGIVVAMPRHPSALRQDCKAANILIVRTKRPRNCAAPDVIIDKWSVRDFGTHVITIGEDKAIKVQTVADSRGKRPWTR